MLALKQPEAPSSSVSERWPVVSGHVRVLNPSGPQSAIYHELFGNLTLVDRELADLLSREVAGCPFVEDVEAHVFDVLWNGYFLVRSEREERDIISGWLTERETLLSSGALVGALQISSSNVCNFSCSYCFADSSDLRSPKRLEIAKGDANISLSLAADAIDKVLRLALNHGKPGIVVKFLGREPLINWKVVRQLLERYADRPIQWAITTNGSLINESIAEDFRRFRVATVVSIDGPAAMNDVFRTFKSGKGTYATVRNKVDLMRRHDVDFGVSSVLSAATDLESLKGFTSEVASWGASQIEFSLAMQTNLVQLQRAYFDARRLAGKLRELYWHAEGLIPLHGDCYDPFQRILSTRKFRTDLDIERPLGAACSASSHQISIEPTGDLFPCRAMSTHYGSIQDLPSALSSEAYRHVAMRTYYNVPMCRGCELEGFCQGTCLGSSEQAFGDVYQPQVDYCDVYRETTRLLLEDWCETKAAAQ